MYFSTLGYSPNILIDKYQQNFLKKIRTLWNIYVGDDIPENEFLLFPDIHGYLLVAARQGNIIKEDHFHILRKKYDQYKKDKILVHEEEIIPGTSIVLTLDFYNPDTTVLNHPDHKKNQIQASYGNISQQDWRLLFSQSFDVVRKVSPGFMNEISSIIKKIIPFDVSYGVHNSGSYSDFIGHLVMSYPMGIDRPELALLEAILHEYNHNKLNLILHTDNLVLNDRREIYYSPYRPDARHIHGIYLGVHAILGAYWVIWNAHISGIITLPLNWQEKAALYVLKNGLSLQVIDKYSQLTPLGREVLEEMRKVHIECLIFIKKANLTQEMFTRVKEKLTQHFYDVKRKYPDLQS